MDPHILHLLASISSLIPRALLGQGYFTPMSSLPTLSTSLVQSPRPACQPGPQYTNCDAQLCGTLQFLEGREDV